LIENYISNPGITEVKMMLGRIDFRGRSKDGDFVYCDENQDRKIAAK
jgi:hypothetical protein